MRCSTRDTEPTSTHDSFRPSRRVRTAPGGEAHDIFGHYVDDDALAGAPPRPVQDNQDTPKRSARTDEQPDPARSRASTGQSSDPARSRASTGQSSQPMSTRHVCLYVQVFLTDVWSTGTILRPYGTQKTLSPRSSLLAEFATFLADAIASLMYVGLIVFVAIVDFRTEHEQIL